MKFTADFETTTDPNDCRVWAYGLFEIGSKDNFIYGNNLDKFMEYIKDKNYTIYFHNLKFDGEFILNWLFRNSFEHVQVKTPLREKTFATLISDKGQFYGLEICFGYSKLLKERLYCKIYDSLKILPFSVDKIAKAFDLPISKLKIDYDEKREIGHELSPEEIAYLRNDVEIVARALETLFRRGTQ